MQINIHPKQRGEVELCCVDGCYSPAAFKVYPRFISLETAPVAYTCEDHVVGGPPLAFATPGKPTRSANV